MFRNKLWMYAQNGLFSENDESFNIIDDKLKRNSIASKNDLISECKTSKFEENENGILKCTKWNSSNILGFIDIPEECLNKEYNLDILAKNINPLIKINSNIYIEKETFIQLKKKRG